MEDIELLNQLLNGNHLEYKDDLERAKEILHSLINVALKSRCLE